ncbi:MAG: hypothetical protein H6Q90_3510 [Deltaproteobacteria bacterium]|nr:hypothetical protein [Deltaproteobacteria bacterium]
MNNLRSVVVLVVAAIAPAAMAKKVAPKVDVVAASLGELRTAANCQDKASPWRPWCIAAEFPSGTAGELPKGKILVGMTVELQQGKDAKQALSDKVSFVALAIDQDGKAKLTDVKPTSKDEEQAVMESIFNTTAVFKGKGPTEWTWTGQTQSRMRKVGAFWVVIEIPKAGNGVFATILTDAWK